MPSPRQISLLFGIALSLVPVALVAAPPQAAAPQEESAALQTRLAATPEEWSIIYPKLQRIAALSAEVRASLADGNRLRSTFASPAGGTSLDAPNIGAAGNIATALFGGKMPFDPRTAPGVAGPASQPERQPGGLLGTDMFKTNQGGTMLALLTELHSLSSTKATPDEQIKNKLAEVRAARTRAASELDAARNDLIPLLTEDQIAILVLLDYLN